MASLEKNLWNLVKKSLEHLSVGGYMFFSQLFSFFGLEDSLCKLAHEIMRMSKFTGA
jgi:hypothetical protein